MDIEEIKSKAIKGVISLTGRAVFLQLANFLTFNFLAGFLGAVNIGIFIAISAVRDIYNLFIDVGLGAAIIQKKDDVSGEDLNNTFLIQESLVIVVVGIGYIATGLVKHYLGLNGSGIFLYWVLLVVLFINSLKVIPSILLERKLEFSKQIFPQLLEAVVFDILVVFLAWKGFGLNSYSWAMITSSIIGLFAYYYVSPWFPVKKFSFAGARRLVTFGLQFQGKSYLAVIKDQLLTLLLTRMVGLTGIAQLGFAQRWAYSPFRFIVDSVTKVTFPTYSRLQHDTKLLRESLETSLFAVSLILFPCLVIIAFMGNYFVHAIPRLNQYQPAVIILYILCVQAAISALSNILINVLDSSGRVKTTLGLMVFWVILTWGLTLALVSSLGIVGAAIAQLIVSLTIVFTVILTKKVIEFTFVGSVIKPVIAVILMVLTGFGVGGIVGLLIGMVVYGLTILVLARREILENTKILATIYRK